MKRLICILLLLLALIPPALSETPGGDFLENPKPEINLSLDLNSRTLVNEAVTATQVSVSGVIYKFDDSRLVPVFQAALERGIKVRLLCDGKQAKKNRSLMDKLIKAGAEIRLWPASQGKLHAKFMVCDENRVLSGSWNLTRSAGQDNVEILMDFRDKKTVVRFQELFARLWDLGRPAQN